MHGAQDCVFVDLACMQLKVVVHVALILGKGLLLEKVRI